METLSETHRPRSLVICGQRSLLRDVSPRSMRLNFLLLMTAWLTITLKEGEVVLYPAFCTTWVGPHADSLQRRGYSGWARWR